MPWFRTSIATLLLLAGIARAAAIDSIYIPIGGGVWQAQFSIENTGEIAPIAEFTIYFPSEQFASLALVTSPDGWDPLIIAPDLAIPAPGFLDGLTTSPASELHTGQWSQEWALQFAYLGSGAPGPLAFEVIDADFKLLSVGQTRVTVVPEPATWTLMVGGLLSAWALRARLRPQRPKSCPFANLTV